MAYDTLILDSPANFAGTIADFAATDTIDLANVASAGASLAFTGGTLHVTGGGTAANLYFGKPYQAGDFTLSSDGGAGTLVTLTPGVIGAGANFRILDTTTNTPAPSDGQAYTGPVSYLQQQYAWAGSDKVNITAAIPNVFLKSGPGDDALAVNSGSNVVDGGSGSNFLVGASGADGGSDTFFVDGRGGQSTWDTLVNFHAGDQLTLWGFDGAAGTTSWVDNQGAAGYQGATLHADFGNGSGASALVTFAALTTTGAQFVTSTGTAGGLAYLAVTRTA